LTDDDFYVLAGANTRAINEQWRVVFADYPLVFVRFDMLDAERKRVGFIGEPIDPADVLKDLPDEMEVTVDAVRDFAQPPGAVSCALTQRQHEAVSVAVDSGYYEVPRESSLDEVADRLDCAESTASTLLRRAESQMVERLVMGLRNCYEIWQYHVVSGSDSESLSLRGLGFFTSASVDEAAT